MKNLMGLLKSARWFELLVFVALIAILLVCALNSSGQKSALYTDEERRLGEVLSEIDGAGRVLVMLRQNAADGSYCAAVVTAEGAENLRVMFKLQQVVKTLTGLKTEQIEIVKSGS